MALSAQSQAIYDEMQNYGESSVTDAAGNKWLSVYLDNVRPAGMTASQFAGHLSALEAAGLYRPIDGKAFGDFRPKAEG